MSKLIEHNIDLSNCYNITDETVRLVGELHTLNLPDSNITDETVRLVGELYTLNLPDCYNMPYN